ncbi:MAG: hypothetical protein QW551_07095 [Desulfurococcaceae archaeon]
MELRIRFEARDIAIITGLLALVVMGIFMVLTDYRTEYVWIVPLNVPRSFSWYYKTNIGIGVVNQVSNTTSLIVFNGIVPGILLGEYDEGYAVIISRGFNAYVLAIVVVDLAMYMVFLLKTRRLAIKGVLGALSLTLLAVLYAMPLLALMPYIDYGHVYGNHEVVEPLQPPVLSIPLSVLNYTEIPDAHPALRYVYRVSDEIREISLVHVNFLFNDTLMPVMFVRALVDGNVVRQERTYNTAFYISRGVVEIYLFSPLPLNNSVLLYYKAEFRQLDQGITPLLFTMPLSLVFIAIVLSALQLQLIKTRTHRWNTG